jgi:alpha-ketoglutarate-dependent taurine dioxygenase
MQLFQGAHFKARVSMPVSLAQGALAVWDIRCTLHQRVDDTVDGSRLMRRVPVAGTDRPVN